MIIDEEILAHLPDDLEIPIQVRVGALKKAIEAKRGGPEELSTPQAASWIGRTSKWWREHAPKIAEHWKRSHPTDPRKGAYTDETGTWRILNAAAREYYAVFTGQVAPTSSSSPRSVRRGPRKSRTTPTEAPSR